MNLLFFPGGAFVGGTEVVTQDLMSQLNDIGHRTMAIVGGWNNGDYPRRLRSSGLSFEEVKLGRFYKSKPLWTLDTLRNLPRAALQLRRIAKDFKPDAAVYPDVQLLLLGSLILPAQRNVLYQHSDASALRKFPALSLVDARLDRIICVSAFVAASARRAGFDSSKIAVVHNGVVPAASDAVGRPHSPLTLGIIGRVSLQKQQAMLIKAIHLVRQRQPSVQFRLQIIGTTEEAYVGEVRQLIEELNLEDLVTWAGFIANRDDVYRGLDVVVAPAVNEAFGMSIVEAAVYGLPVVAARSGGFPEVVLDGETGLLFDDLEGFAAAIERLVLDPALRTRLGSAARAHVAQNFTMKRMAENFVEAVGSRSS